MTPEVGTELVNPKAGTRTVFTATAESTDGEYVEIEATYPPHGRFGVHTTFAWINVNPLNDASGSTVSLSVS